MATFAICRVCLTSNVRMHCMYSLRLQEMFENVTRIKLNTVERPVTICYICLPRLQKCHRFLEMCQTAEETFMDLIQSGIEVKGDSLGLLNLGSIQNFSLTTPPTSFITIDNIPTKESFHDTSEVINEVKEESLLDSLVKTEKKKKDGQCFEIEESDEETELKVNNDSQNGRKIIIEIEEDTNIVKYEVALDMKNLPIKGRPIRETATLNCTYCDTKCLSKHDLSIHMKKHIKTNPFSCDRCPKSYSNEAEFKQHKLIHIGRKNVSCNLCSKMFSSKYYCLTHKRKHHGEKVHPCKLCDQVFTKCILLKKHLQTNHVRERRFNCDICGKKYLVHAHLKEHMMSLHSEQLYTCNVCFQAFNYKRYLKVHLKSHCCPRF